MATIMIVDDSELILAWARAVLEAAGHRVVTVDSPFGASAAILRNEPKLVLVDINMPALPGDALVSIARRRTSSIGATVVLHSDKPIEELQSVARACGADGYIPKTSDKASFLVQVNSYLRDGQHGSPAG